MPERSIRSIVEPKPAAPARRAHVRRSSRDVSVIVFLGGHNYVTGIPTRADLNTAPSCIYFFGRITYLKKHLCELILATKPAWKTTSVIPVKLDDVETPYKDPQAANVALDDLHYVNSPPSKQPAISPRTSTNRGTTREDTYR